MCCTPITIKVNGEHIKVPCGHCIECVQEIQNSWTIRMIEELKAEPTRPACFLTLTYRDEDLPEVVWDEETGELYKAKSVYYKDVQDFMKRLRRQVEYHNKSPWKLRYFVASEYGEKFGRPHYHMILYGVGPEHAKLIEKCWKKGFIYVEPANSATMGYVAKYCAKNVTASYLAHKRGNKGYYDKDKYLQEQGVRVKPFRHMSQGLGMKYTIKDANLRFHFADVRKRFYYPNNGYKLALPRAYKQAIYTAENFEKYANIDDMKLGMLSNVSRAVLMKQEEEDRMKVKQMELKAKLHSKTYGTDEEDEMLRFLRMDFMTDLQREDTKYDLWLKKQRERVDSKDNQ